MKAVYSSTLMEFVRNMDFTTGRAFALAWGLDEIDPNPESEINTLIVESLTWRPAQLHPTLAERLRRKLCMLAANFQDDVYLLLDCLLRAAEGDYDLLNVYAREYRVLPSQDSYSLYFDDEQEELKKPSND